MALMHSSWRLARNTLDGRPGRTALMIGAVTLAAALIVSVSCAVASVQASMELGIVRILGAANARIIHQFNSRFDDALLAQVRAWPEVQRATGRLAGSLTLVHADQRRDPRTGQLLRATPSALGVDFALEPAFRDAALLAGRRPGNPREILIDPLTADELHASVGDALQVQRFGEPIDLTVAGIYDRQRLGAIQRPLIEVDRVTLAEATDKPGQLTSIAIIVQPGVDVQAFCSARQSSLPPMLALEPAEIVRSGFDRQIAASRFGFTVASILTFMCAGFIIVTALTTSVAQRQREMAVTRSIGASRVQLFLSQIMAGLGLAGAGAAIGIPLGIALAWLLIRYFHDILPAGLRVHPLGVRLAVAGAIGAGLLGALYPAWMASRVSPLQALSYRARPPSRFGLAMCAAGALGCIGAQLAFMLPDDPDTRFYAYAYLGLPALLLGYFLLATPVLLAVNALATPLLARLLRLPRGMMERSILATPYRHGFTAGALMVGIAILVSTWSSAASMFQDWLAKIKFADGFAYRGSGIPPRDQQIIASLPFVEAVCPIGYLPLRVLDRQIFGVQGIGPANVTCIGFDPDVFFSINAVEWSAGEPAAALARLKDGSGIIVADRFLTTQRVQLGDTLTLGAGRVQQQFQIVGAVNSAGLDIATQLFGIRNQYMEHSISCVFMDWKTVARVFDNRDAYMMQVNLRPGISDEEARNAILAAAPGVQFRSGRWIVKTINQVAATVLSVQSCVAFAALVLASLGAGNVILANIEARRYEYGVLRAVGAPRSMMARLVLGEAAILALAAAVTGTFLGLHLAWVGALQYRELAGLPLRLAVPGIPTAAGWALLLILTLLAALPGVRPLIRRQPAALLASGRHA